MPRELIETHKGDKSYVRRDRKGNFAKQQDDGGRSLAADRRRKAKTAAKKARDPRARRRRPAPRAAPSRP
jgi:hypothetical protein